VPTPPPHPSPKVGIVVLNYKNYNDTIGCLRSLARITYPNIEIIVVDNDSQNDSLAKVREFLALSGTVPASIDEAGMATSDQLPGPVILLQAARNGGYAVGNNLGIRVALKRHADYILILNSDTEVAPNFLEPLIHVAESNPKLGAVGPKVQNTDGSLAPACARRRPNPWAYFFYFGMGRLLFPRSPWVRRYYYQGEYQFDHPREVDILSGCCMLLKAEAISRVGLFDENTFLLQEEVILHERFRTCGFTSAVAPDSVIVHKHGGSTSMAPSRTVMAAKRASMRYYLSQYRNLSPLAVRVVMLSIALPDRLLRRLRVRRSRRRSA